MSRPYKVNVTHCHLVKYLYGGLGIKGEFLSRYLMFYGSVCNSTNRHINYALNFYRLLNEYMYSVLGLSSVVVI